MGGEKKPLVMSELGCADGCGRLRTANGPELRGRLRTARVRGSGWKWVGRRSRWRSAAQFSAPISRPQPSAQPSSLIPSGFWRTHFQPLPCTHAVGSAILPTHLPSAAVRAAKLAHPQRLLLPNHFQPLPCTSCTRAVRSRPRNSPHLFAVRSRARSHARLRTAWVQGSGWKWMGRRTRCSPRTRMLTRMLMNMQSLRTSQNNFLQ